MLLIITLSKYKKKAWESCQSSIPLLEALALPKIAETDNAESPRMAYIIPIRGQPQIYTNGTYTTTHGRVQHTYREHPSLSCLFDDFSNLRDYEQSKTSVR